MPKTVEKRQAKIYLWMDEETGEISLSSYPVDDPEYELNNVVLYSARHGGVNKNPWVLQTISNVLTASGAIVEIEQ